MLDKIPDHVKSIVEDKNWNEIFIFEEMTCNHSQNAKKFEKVNCLKCNFDERETWLETELTNQNLNQQITIENIPKKLKKIKVLRGSYDDCIGIEKEWD